MQDYTGNRQNGMNGEDPVFLSLKVIEERIREKLTVQSLADCVHFSKYHYQRLFREAVGDSVMGYVVRRRLSLAAAELAETDASVLEIALKYGYDSHEGFTRSFKSCLGITPTEYRKYSLFTGVPGAGKERNAMIYSRTTDEIIRELNGLIVQAREAAAYTRKAMETSSGAAVFYVDFWNYIAAGTEALAEELTGLLSRVTAITGRPDEISARFLIMKAVEDVVFRTGLTAFQTGLTTARAKPEHREILGGICEKYEALARNSRMKTARIAEFMEELSALILRDMRETAKRQLQEAVERGLAAARALSSDPALPYGYIADEIRDIAEELSATPLERVTVSRLEDCLFRLDIVAFAADADALRVPSHRQMFDGIRVFREQVGEAAEFFRSLPAGIGRMPAGTGHMPAGPGSVPAGTGHMPAEPGENTGAGEKGVSGGAADGKYSASVLWGKILLFYLKGEIRKLGDEHLDAEQKAAFNDICDKMSAAVRRMGQPVNEAAEGAMEQAAEGAMEQAAEGAMEQAAEGAMEQAAEGTIEQAADEKTERLVNKPIKQAACAAAITKILREIYDEMSRQAEKLGIYGAPVQYIAEEVKGLMPSFE